MKYMSNKITASIIFCFKGKRYSPSLDLDLDRYMQSSGQIPNLYPLIARASNVDLYSYEYEIMQAEPIKFSKPQGMVAEHVIGNTLDIKAFESAWLEHKILQQLQEITANSMAINNLQQHPELMEALLQAYHLGKNQN
ncbi:hypothetical protein MNBD_GAMMA24-208 [hydrothermal vent metagenome]|uniref:Uncharacterized protein n=1 Tax=hydrothermal vent metagenome TaxID=652676 RepID=A0A3B1BPX1_9ZZZZ